MAKYTKTDQQTIELGGLRFVVMHREFRGDGGPTIEVYGKVGGKLEQVARFDCFRQQPHYHAPVEGAPPKQLDPAAVGDGLEWALTQIRDHMPELLETAGYPELARGVAREALARDWGRLKDAVSSTTPVA